MVKAVITACPTHDGIGKFFSVAFMASKKYLRHMLISGEATPTATTIAAIQNTTLQMFVPAMVLLPHAIASATLKIGCIFEKTCKTFLKMQPIKFLKDNLIILIISLPYIIVNGLEDNKI
jgi:hypothetical protein